MSSLAINVFEMADNTDLVASQIEKKRKTSSSEPSNYQLVVDAFQKDIKVIYSIGDLIFRPSEDNACYFVLGGDKYLILDFEGGVLLSRKGGGFRILLPVLKQGEDMYLIHIEESVWAEDYDKGILQDLDLKMPSLDPQKLIRIARRVDLQRYHYKFDIDLAEERICQEAIEAVKSQLGELYGTTIDGYLDIDERNEAARKQFLDGLIEHSRCHDFATNPEAFIPHWDKLRERLLQKRNKSYKVQKCEGGKEREV